MTTEAPPARDLHLVVGYDGSPPATRALESAVALLQGRTGRIDVLYVAHLSSTVMLSADAVAEMEVDFDEIAEELRKQAGEQLSGRDVAWGFEQRQGVIAEELIAAASGARASHPDDTAVIVVGSSSHAMHRMVGSVAVSLARHSPVPLVVVP